MAGSDFDIVLKKEAKTSLAVFKDQSLLRRKFGEDAVALYNAIDSGKTAAEIIADVGMDEEKFIEILEFMNNNGMVSITPSEPLQAQSPPTSPAPPSDEGDGSREDSGAPGSEGENEEEPAAKQPEEGAGAKKPAPAPKTVKIFPKPGRDSEEKLFSPLEKILYEKYGDMGVRVYSLIDGEKTAEEILRETGISEAKLVEILEFMDERGIIKLEKPAGSGEPPEGDGGDSGEDDSPVDGGSGKGGEDNEEGGDGSESAPEGDGEGKADEEPAREPRFSPMEEDVPEGKPYVPAPPPLKKKEEKKEPVIEEPGEDIVMVDVPTLGKLTLMQNASMFADLNTKFDKRAALLMKMSDGSHDFVELSLSTGMALYEVDAVMAYFGKKGFVTFRQLERPEIKKRYGEDGFAIYKKYGREGLLLYEMIGKEASLKDIILKSRVDPERAIDIFMFIHKVLGLDVPLDRDIIYRQIGLKK